MARLLFEEQAVRTRRGSLSTGIEYVVYTDAAGTVLADISATIGASATSTATVNAATSTVTSADIAGIGPASLKFYGPDNVDNLYLRCPADPDLGVQEIEADPDKRLDTLEAAGGGGIHPDLAAHDSLGLATDAELTTHAADTTSVHGITDTSVLATDVEVASAVSTHEGQADPHTGYVTDAGLAAHTGDTANPHTVTKAQVGLGSADNTSDVAKPVSTATQAALDAHAAAGDPHAVYETSVEAAAKVAAHEADTTSVHGIADTTALATSSSVTSAVSTHAGLADPHAGYVLESLYDAKGDLLPSSAADTPARLAVGANDTVLTADSAQVTGLKWAAPAAVTHPDLATHDALGLATDAELATHVAAANPHSVYATDTDLSTHEADTTLIHGITDTSVLATATSVAAAVSAHEADTTGVHGITDATVLATTSGVTSAVSTHAGLADPHTGYVLESLLDAKGDIVAASADNTPAKLTAGANDTVLTADSSTGTGLKWAAPAAHPNLATHDGLGLATDAELATHAAAADPHTGYVLESLVDVKGDIIAATAADTVARLAVGADGLVLKAASGQATGLQWAAETAHPNLATHDSLGLATDAELTTHAGAADPHTGYVLESLYDAKGDLLPASADNTPAKLTVGANDTVLTADSAQASGLKWATPAAHPNLATHDGLGLATDAELAAHEADTTSIHGITNTANLVVNAQTAVVGLGVAAEAGKQLLVKGQATTDTVLVVRGVASQSGNLMEFQDSTGAAVMKFDIGGNIQGATFQPATTPGTGAYFAFNSNMAQVVQRTAGNHILLLQGASGQTGLIQLWQVAGVTKGYVDATGKLGFAAGNEQTTVGAAGGASALPATPTKYLKIIESGGGTLVIPAYAA